MFALMHDLSASAQFYACTHIFQTTLPIHELCTLRATATNGRESSKVPLLATLALQAAFRRTINIWPCVAGASGAVVWAPRRPHHVTTWSTPRHPDANRPFLIEAILSNPPPPLKGARVFPVTATSSSSVTASSLFPNPPAPLNGSSEIGGVRAGARESPG